MEQLVAFTVGVLLVAVLSLGVLLAARTNKYSDVPRAFYYKPRRLTKLQIDSMRNFPMIMSATDVIIVDVSRWQGFINFVKMWARGAWGVIIKCGQGRGLDPKFQENWQTAKFAGLRRGSYWYYDSRIPPKEQARIWAEAIAGDSGELPHFADYEEDYGGQYAGIANFTTFLIEFQRLSKLPTQRLGIYTGYFYWLEHGANDKFFKNYWLWLAWYGSAEEVIIPRPWTQVDLLLWQFTDLGDGNGYGASGSLEIDLNYFVKGKSIFVDMYGSVAEVPDTGEDMAIWYRVRATAGLNIRKDAGGAKIGVLQYGDVIEQLEKRNGWVRFDRIFRNDEFIPAPVADNSWSTDSYLIETSAPIVVEPDPDPEQPAVKHVIEVYDDGSLKVDDGETIP